MAHILVFPFMTKGHIIPILHLTKLIHRHRPEATFTVFTTPANEPFVSLSLATLPSDLVNIISLPFQDPELGVEFHAFAKATDQLRPTFETALDKLQNGCKKVSFLISDGFLYWTQESASKFGIPRLVFYGMSNYAQTICRLVSQHKSLSGPEANDELICVPDFPWVRVTKNDFESPFNEPEPKGPKFDFVVNCAIATSKSYGLLVNSFYELEPKFVDYWNSRFEPTSWSIGPFCLAEKPKFERVYGKSAAWIEWLDRKQAERKPVLYVAFGSQAEISNEQLKEIVIGLEKSGADFLWALRIKPNQEEVMEGFEERVKGRGLVVKGWVEQREVLEHESVQGFLSHCGLNSVMESICAGVPILAWPMMAEQPLNARMVVEEVKVGLRVETHDGFVEGEGLSKMVRELMGGERGKVVRNKVTKISRGADTAVEEGGSSWCNMESLLNELETTETSVCYENGMTSYEKNGFALTIAN